MKKHNGHLRAQLIELRDFLPPLKGAVYKNTAEFILREGEVFQSAELTQAEVDVVKRAMGRKRFESKVCYYNAQRLVLADTTGTLEYVEGYTRELFHHAWVALGPKVIDVAFRHGRDRGRPILGTLPPEREYAGVRFARAYLAGALKGRSAIAFLEDWEAGWPVLRDTSRAWRAPARSGRTDIHHDGKVSK